MGIPIIESEEELKQLNDELVKMDMLLIIKIHPMQVSGDNKSTWHVKCLCAYRKHCEKSECRQLQTVKRFRCFIK